MPSAKAGDKKLRAQQAVKLVAPSKSSRKVQASESIGDSTALRLIASSKLMRTAYELSDPVEDCLGG